MSRRVHDLSLSNLDDLPPSCRACVFWEVAGAPQGPRAGTEETSRAQKEAWWQATQLEWGTPGKALYADDKLVGYATFAPGRHFPRTRRMRRTISEDALLLATLWIHPDRREFGGAKTVLQSVLREAVRRGSRAVEVYAARGAGEGSRLTTCVLPEEFLLAAGFELHRDDPEYPLLRLDLRKTVRWQESVGHALENVLTVLSRRERAPAPSRPALEARR